MLTTRSRHTGMNGLAEVQNAASNLESILQIAQLVVDDCDDPELGSQPAIVLHQVASEGRKMSFGLAAAREESQRLSEADFPDPDLNEAVERRTLARVIGEQFGVS